MPIQDLPIAILGTNLAGLICARQLKRAGKQSVLFDMGSPRGGRLATRRMHFDPTIQFDHGAQFFTATSPRFQMEVAQWVKSGIINSWSPRHMHYVEKKWSRPAPTQPWYVGAASMADFPAHLAKELQIVNNQVVHEILVRKGGYWLKSKTNDQFGPFGGIVFNLAPHVASKLMEPLPRNLLSTLPDCPQLSSWTLMINFGGSIPSPFDTALIAHKSLRWATRDSSKPNRPPGERWVVHGDLAYSQRNFNTAKEDVGEVLLQDFFEVLNIRPWNPLSMSIIRWEYPERMEKLESSSLFDEESTVGLCGAWCLDGKAEGAYFSGIDMAKRILATN